MTSFLGSEDSNPSYALAFQLFSRAMFANIIRQIALVLLLVQGVEAATLNETFNQKQPDTSFYEGRAAGWYWYEDPLQKTEETIETKQNSSVSSPAPVFGAAWMREMLPRYRDLMWSDPSEENVNAYMLLQRFALDRSQEVSQQVQKSVLGNALLDETFRRPLATFGSHVVDDQTKLNKEEVLAKISKRAGLFFFFQGHCSFCERQAPIVKYMQNRDFDVLPISLDGSELQSAAFEKTYLDSGQASQLGVVQTPALFLVSPEGEFVALSQGLLSLSELEDRILLGAKNRRWITEAEYSTVRPILKAQDQPDLSKVVGPNVDEGPVSASDEDLKTLKRLQQRELVDQADESGFIPPKALLQLLDKKKAVEQPQHIKFPKEL